MAALDPLQPFRLPLSGRASPQKRTFARGIRATPCISK